VEENNLAQHISQVRRVLGGAGSGVVIETVPKRGYRFVWPVTEFSDSAAASDRRAPEPAIAPEGVSPAPDRIDAPADAHAAGVLGGRRVAWAGGLLVVALMAA
jgi:DNA-binding winged helix-turn-helix (wHTH) protein